MQAHRPNALIGAVDCQISGDDADWEEPDARFFEPVEALRRDLQARPASPFECSAQTRSRRNLETQRFPGGTRRRAADARYSNEEQHSANIEPGFVQRCVDIYSEVSSPAPIVTAGPVGDRYLSMGPHTDAASTSSASASAATVDVTNMSGLAAHIPSLPNQGYPDISGLTPEEKGALPARLVVFNLVKESV